MCGFCGVVEKRPERDILIQMVSAIKHRGPDAQQVRIYPENSCGMAHARLSIIDLSQAANQPMDYGPFSIVFNGEIYNFREIKAELTSLGHVFHLESDTEVILHSFAQWGKKCVEKMIGMFAFAILDSKENKLWIFRDRAGVKPLYYYQDASLFMFASELKCFYHHPGFHKVIDKNAVALYFKYHHVPTPYAIFEKTRKLPPGHYMIYDINSSSIIIEQYWNVLDYYCRPLSKLSYEEAKDELEDILNTSFKYRMVSDVPVGVFLSGGYDSCGVAALLQNGMTDKLKTFTIGFPIGRNEAPEANKIAKYLGTDHTEYICEPEDAKKIIPEIPYYYDEPFDDSSAIPTILVSRLAKKQVKVALSADGGDETFAGYTNSARIEKLKNIIGLTDFFHSNFASNTIHLLCSLLNQYSDLREKGETFAKLLSAEPYYKYSMCVEGSSNMMESLFRKLVNADYPPFIFLQDDRKFNDPMSVALALDYLNYLPNDILTKVDRATMSVSLEGREPLLDHRIIEFVASLPVSYKLYNGQGKRIYKDIVHKYIPRDLMDRPKSGFGVPILEWLKGDMRYLLEDTINEDMDSQFLNVPYVLKLKKLFLSDRLGHEERLIWRIIEFQLWYKTIKQ